MRYLSRCVDTHLCLCVVFETLQNSGAQTVFGGSQRIHGHFPEDPWVHFCNGYCEVYFLDKGIMFC
jgi:hypothetical protein